MCVLCDPRALELLVAPLERLSAADRVQAIRMGREAAAASAAPLVESTLLGEEVFGGEPEAYLEAVVERAREDGVLGRAGAFLWEADVQAGRALRDPRVQAFLAGCAELVAENQARAAEERTLLARFLETRPATVRFASLGRGWELWFAHDGHGYAVLHRDDRVRVAAVYLEGTLHAADAAELLPYTGLPGSGLALLRDVQGHAPDEADDLLAGIVDVEAMAQERVRRHGLARLMAGEGAEEIPFGEHVVVRAPRVPEMG
jgi:hypothetical protein